jgi:molybdenum cofactor cytidylyltransferase
MQNALMTPRNLFAVIPAAGWSRRMGQPKLLLPLGAKTVIGRLLEILDRPPILCRAVVVRSKDQELLEEVTKGGGFAVQPELDPPEMRQSVELALAAIRENHSPKPEDGWLLVPADHPVLSAGVVDELIAAWQRATAEILVPTCQNRRGHPTVFSWTLADAVANIPIDQGLNWLVRHSGASVQEIAVEDPAIFTDLDTPEDYERLKRSFPAES